MTNPLMDTTPRAPEYDQVKPEHFMPAYDAAIGNVRRYAVQIKADQTPPTFDNIAAPLERIFTDISRVNRIYKAFEANNSDKKIEDLSETISLKVSAIIKEICQDQELAARFSALYASRDKLGLDEEQHRVMENLYRSFESNGTFLDDADQQELNRIHNELIAACNTFRQNMRAGFNQQAFLVQGTAELDGVPNDIRDTMQENVAGVLAGLKPGAKDADKEYVAALPVAVVDAIKAAEKNGTVSDLYLFQPERLQVDQLLVTAADPAFRSRIFESLNRIGTVAPYDSEDALRAVQRLRQERIALLNKGREPGTEYKNYADFALGKTMAGSFAAVDGLIARLEQPLLRKFEDDISKVEAFAARKGFAAPVEPWDLPYWSARYKQETWQFDGAKMSEYLEVGNVVQGFLDHSAKLFGLTYAENPAYSKIHPDVRVFDVTDSKTGAHLGMLHMDLFARPGKRDGAWATLLQHEDTDTHGRLPVAAIMNCNLAKPAAGEPALMSVGQVETLFHEGGHALNQILGTKARFRTLRGTAHPSDFVENHSMVQERWAFAPQVLATYAKHHKTGEAPPQDLIDAMEKSASFMNARDPLLLIQNSRRDFLFHSMDPADYKGTADLNRRAALQSAKAGHIRPYPLTRFSHLFDTPDSSYAAGYYSYLWADSCAADIYSFFEKAGLYDPALSGKLKEFYSDGARRESAATYRTFAGRDPDPAAFLRQLGITAAGGGTAPAAPAPKP